jgi:5-methylcytosine-specific restriction endonuclease McrA
MASFREVTEELLHRHRCRQMRETTLRRVCAYLERAAEREQSRAMNAARPSILLRPDLTCYDCAVTGKTFFNATYGCIVAVGETPDRAYQQFDEAWVHGEN